MDKNLTVGYQKTASLFDDGSFVEIARIQICHVIHMNLLRLYI